MYSIFSNAISCILFSDSGKDTLEIHLQKYFPGNQILEGTQPVLIPASESITRFNKKDWNYVVQVNFKSPGRNGIFPVLLYRGQELLLPSGLPEDVHKVVYFYPYCNVCNLLNDLFRQEIHFHCYTDDHN